MEPATNTDRVTEAEVSALGSSLRAALSAALQLEKNAVPRPMDLGRTWGIEQTQAIRICQALRAHDPLAVVHALPGIAGLRLFLANLRKKRAPADALRSLGDVIDLLEQVIARVGGQKSSLDTLIGGQVREVRARTEHTSKQNLYRGMSNLLGIRAETSLASYFVYPSEDPEWCDELALYGVDRLRRLRTDSPTLVGGRILTDPQPDIVPLARDVLLGGEVTENGLATALHGFSTSPLPPIDVELRGSQLHYTLPTSERGDEGELSLFFASIEKKARPRRRQGDTVTSSGHRFVPRNPSRNMLLDVFVHKDVWPGAEPTLVISRSASARARDREAGHVDLVPLVEVVQHLGRDPNTVPHRCLPSYGNMVSRLRILRGWSPDEFRAFRCHVRYPVVGMWYSIEFDIAP